MRNLVSSVLILSVLAIGALAQTKAAPQSPAASKSTAPAAKGEGLPTAATVESFLKQTFGYDPTITYQVLSITPSRAPGVADVNVALKNSQGQQNVHLFVLPGAKYAVVGDAMPFGADPFAPARAEIASRANGPARGPASAAVTLVEFSDLECPSCKAAQPTIDKLLNDEPDVRFIFQHYPLERVHPWAFLGATYADCVATQSQPAFWKFIETVYGSQEQVSALLPQNFSNPEEAMKQARPAIAKKLQEIAGTAGANPQQVATCAAAPATAERIRKSLQLGEDLEVTGTPTLYVNGRRIANVNGMPYELLKGIVDSAKNPK